jgi:NitT/TauT family transport system permease protein/taurine transport system permease protein
MLKRRLIEIGLKSSVLVLILVVWQIACGVILSKTNPGFVAILPPPSLVFEQAVKLMGSGVLFLHILKSIQRVLIAFAIASLLAIPLGIAIGWWKRCEDMIDPLMEILRPIPPLAWIPLGILWFGIGDPQNIFIIFLGVFFPVLVNTISGVKGVDKNLIWGALTLGANERQIFREIVLPGSLPFILTGLRVGLGVGWMCLVAAELVASTRGLGFMIQDARYLLLTERVILGMLVIGLLGYGMDRGMRYLQWRLLPWYATQR